MRRPLSVLPRLLNPVLPDLFSGESSTSGVGLELCLQNLGQEVQWLLGSSVPRPRRIYVKEEASKFIGSTARLNYRRSVVLSMAPPRARAVFCATCGVAFNFRHSATNSWAVKAYVAAYCDAPVAGAPAPASEEPHRARPDRSPHGRSLRTEWSTCNNCARSSPCGGIDDRPDSSYMGVNNGDIACRVSSVMARTSQRMVRVHRCSGGK